MAQGDENVDWNAVIARSLAYLCLHASDVDGKGLLEEARFLMGLGLPRADAAALLGSSDDSLRVTLGRAQRTAKRGAKKSSAKKAAAKKGA
jgi:hypothetical protein